jgi:PAS domain S-box-containing protein
LNQLRVEREAQSISERLAHVGTFRRSFIDGSAYWSSELNRITGRELSAEAPGWDDRLTRFTVPSQLKLERAFEQAKIDGLGYDVEVDFFRDDGRVGRAILASEFARDASGQLTSQVGCFVDITALHETRLESESARERLQALFDRTLNGILLLDDHGRFVEANPAVCAMFGHSREAILRLSMAEFLVGDVERTPSEATLFHFLRSLGDRGLLQLRSASGTDRVAEISVAQDVQPGLHLCILSDVTARVHAERALAAAEASLSQLAARQRDEFDALRAELARDVHDVLGQSLSALMLELGALGPELGEHAARLKLLLRQAIDTTRDLSRALRPAALDLGLAAALRALAEEVSMRTDVDISTDIPATVPCLPEASTRGIYRVVQEALSNVVRHSGARKASVTVKIAVGKLTVSVRDDGCGFDGDVLTRGLGVVGMKERARQIGAQFSVCGAMGCGVTVQVVLPVP